jgi:murein L,D-transpeptidase YafK
MRSALRQALIGIVVFAAAIAALWIGFVWYGGDDDSAHLSRERIRRLAVFTTKGELPNTPNTDRLDLRLAEQAMSLGSPVFIRIFKQEFELELWLKHGDRFKLFATYPICNFSGGLGPKLKEGDRQSPEGFYTVDAKALNPNSRWHKSFNLGFPNLLDRAHDRTGTFLMVHGGCSSVGCYAMTDPVIDEIWTLITAAFKAGQPRFQVQVFPFRMTDAAIAKHSAAPWSTFWQDLKAGYDAFEMSQLPPRVHVCKGRYRLTMAANGSGAVTDVTESCAGSAAQLIQNPSLSPLSPQSPGTLRLKSHIAGAGKQ